MTPAFAISMSTVTVLACRLAIAATAMAWLAASAWLQLAVALTALLLTALPALLPMRTALREVWSVLLSLLLAAHIVLGMQLGLYETSGLYDKIMHAGGSAAIACALIPVLWGFCRDRSIELPARLAATLVFALTLSAGALWELFEFGIDRTGLFVSQRGLNDTMVDLLADALGAAVGAAACWVGVLRGVSRRTPTGRAV